MALVFLLGRISGGTGQAEHPEQLQTAPPATVTEVPVTEAPVTEAPTEATQPPTTEATQPRLSGMLARRLPWVFIAKEETVWSLLSGRFWMFAGIRLW